MKRSIHTLELFREVDFLGGGTAITKLPTYSELALEAWNKTADKGLIYSPSNDSLTPNWNDDGIQKETGLDASIKETKMYIRALAELPRVTYSQRRSNETAWASYQLQRSYWLTRETIGLNANLCPYPSNGSRAKPREARLQPYQ